MNFSVLLQFNQMLRILDLGVHTAKNQHTHPNRTLDWNVFLYVSEGQMQVWEEDKEYVIKKGQFLFLKSGLHHWGEPKTPAGTSWYWIHFYGHSDTETFQELNVYLTPTPSLSISQEDYRKFIALPKQGEISQRKKMEQRLEPIVRIFQSADPFRAVTLSLQTMKLFSDLFRETMQKSPLTKSDRTAQRIMEYLEQKKGYALNSQELSNSLDMNYSYLSEVFKKKNGSTIHFFNSQIFMDKAVRMMRNSNRNISEISDLLGFKNPFYFSRVFRKVMGCSPSEYMSRVYRDNE